MRHDTGIASISTIARPPAVDVVVLVAPTRRSAWLSTLDAITHAGRRPHTAVLVVFERAADIDLLHEAEAAGADLCVVAPAPRDLFAHIERTRAHYRGRSAQAGRERAPANEDPLDRLWRATHCPRNT